MRRGSELENVLQQLDSTDEGIEMEEAEMGGERGGERGGAALAQAFSRKVGPRGKREAMPPRVQYLAMKTMSKHGIGREDAESVHRGMYSGLYLVRISYPTMRS
jgi:hypothetical protein